MPKSTKPHRIAENFDVFDFELSAGELKAIDALDMGRSGGRRVGERLRRSGYFVYFRHVVPSGRRFQDFATQATKSRCSRETAASRGHGLDLCATRSRLNATDEGIRRRNVR